MIDLRPFDGGPEELQSFVGDCWGAAYQGKMAFPVWSPDYFRWQLGFDEPRGPERPVIHAAYDGARLVGVLPSIPLEFRTPRGRLSGSQGSWLTVHADYRKAGVAAQLREEMRQWHREHGRVIQLGYGYFGSSHSRGPKFWRQHLQETQFLTRLGFWACVLDWRRAAAWDLSVWQSRLIRWFARWRRPPVRRDLGESSAIEAAGPAKQIAQRAAPGGPIRLRWGRPEDVPDCLKLLAQETAEFDLAIDWTPGTLARQLAPTKGPPRFIVADFGGRVAGFIGFHLLPMQAKCVELVSVLDFVVFGELGLSESRALLDTALAESLESGAVVALKLRAGDGGAGRLLWRGFVPRTADSHLLLTFAGDPDPWPSVSRLHLLWR